MTNVFAGAFSALVPSRIRWKIVAPYLVLTLLVAVSGTFLATRLVTDSLDDRFSAQLSEAGTVASDAIVRREQAHLETLRLIAYTVGVSESVEAHDGEALRALIEPIVANDQREYVHVLDATGRSMLDLRLESGNLAYEPIVGSDELWASDMVRRVTAGGDVLGDKSAQLVRGADGPCYTRPVR